MNDLMLVRYYHPESGTCLGLNIDGTVYDINNHASSVAEWLQSSAGRVADSINELREAASRSPRQHDAAIFENAPGEHHPHWLAPVDRQDIWAAGVTYLRSRDARQEEAIDGGDIYARVYDAERPELFFKAHGRNSIGPLGQVGIRADATWSVPEPELGLVMNPRMEVVGFTVGNDMSSRDIEGENPLYLPQAKSYNASCGIGPGIVLHESYDWPPTSVRMTIRRNNTDVFTGSISTSQLKRNMRELLDYLGRSNDFPYGVVLLTGTGIVPPGDFTLQVGDEVIITIDDIGTLANTVKVV
jgi:2-dehydro-3-deoxy-D-arabinonate dehydratase